MRQSVVEDKLNEMEAGGKGRHEGGCVRVQLALWGTE